MKVVGKRLLQDQDGVDRRDTSFLITLLAIQKQLVNILLNILVSSC